MVDEFGFVRPPRYVGGYHVGGPAGLVINLTERPCWLHRQMMRWCFGWEWRDASRKRETSRMV